MQGFLERQMVIIYVRWCEKICRFTSFNDHYDVLNIYQQSTVILSRILFHYEEKNWMKVLLY